MEILAAGRLDRASYVVPDDGTEDDAQFAAHFTLDKVKNIVARDQRRGGTYATDTITIVIPQGDLPPGDYFVQVHYWSDHDTGLDSHCTVVITLHEGTDDESIDEASLRRMVEFVARLGDLNHRMHNKVLIADGQQGRGQRVAAECELAGYDWKIAAHGAQALEDGIGPVPGEQAASIRPSRTRRVVFAGGR